MYRYDTVELLLSYTDDIKKPLKNERTVLDLAKVRLDKGDDIFELLENS